MIMKLSTTIGIFLLIFLSMNAQQIDNNIYQVLKSNDALYSNQQIKLVGENKNKKVYELEFTNPEAYDEATLIVYNSNNFEFIYDTQMGKNHTKIILSKQYSNISKTIISTGCGLGCYTAYEQYHNGKKVFEKTYYED